MRLRQAPVVYGFCTGCYARSGDARRAIMDGNSCPICGQSFRDNTAHSVVLNRLIVVGVDEGVRCYKPTVRLKCGRTADHFRVVTCQPPPGKLDDFWSNYHPVPGDWPGNNEWERWESYRLISALLKSGTAIAKVENRLRRLQQGLRRLADKTRDPKRLQLVSSLTEHAGTTGVRELWSAKVSAVRCPLCGGDAPDRATNVWKWES